MDQHKIDLDSVNNVRHRAVPRALLETTLPSQEICRRLGVTPKVLRYVADRHIHHGFMAERRQELALGELRAVALGQGDAGPSATGLDQDNGEVTVISLPAVVADNGSRQGQQGEVPAAVPAGCGRLASAREREIYGFLTRLWENQGSLPSVDKINARMQEAGIGSTSPNYIVRVRKAWLRDHAMGIDETRGPHALEAAVPRHGEATGERPAAQATLTAEMGGMRVTLQCGPSCGELVGEVLRALRGAMGARNG